MTQKEQKKYTKKLNQILDLRDRIKYMEKSGGYFEMKDSDLKVVKYCLKQTEGLLEILLEADPVEKEV